MTCDSLAPSLNPLNLSDLPTPPEHWLKGSIGRFKPEQLHRYFLDHAEQLGPIYKIHLLRKPCIVLTDAKAIQKIFKDRPHTYRRSKVMEKVFAEMGTHGIFTAEGDQWSRYRKLMNPAFRTGQIKQFYQSLGSITDRLIKALEQSPKVFNFQPLIQRYTVDITSLLSFGYDINTLDNPDNELQEHLCKIFPMISIRIKSPIPYWRWFKLKKDRDLDASLKVVHQQVAEFIEIAKAKLHQRQAQAADNSEEFLADNLLEAMLLSRDDNNEGFNDDELVGNVFTLLLAGEDTTANTLAWTVDFLADREDLQDQIFEEIEANLPRTNGEIAPLKFDQLDSCPLLLAVINESMRLRPAASILTMQGLEDSEVCGYHVPKDTPIFMHLSATSFDPDVFDQPNEFKPERWLSMSEAQLKQVNKDLMPFGGGTRLCPGRLLSLVEMKMALIEMLRRYRFTRPEGYSAGKELLNFTLMPDQVMVTVTAR